MCPLQHRKMTVLGSPDASLSFSPKHLGGHSRQQLNSCFMYHEHLFSLAWPPRAAASHIFFPQRHPFSFNHSLAFGTMVGFCIQWTAIIPRPFQHRERAFCCRHCRKAETEMGKGRKEPSPLFADQPADELAGLRSISKNVVRHLCGKGVPSSNFNLVFSHRRACLIYSPLIEVIEYVLPVSKTGNAMNVDLIF